MSQSVCGDVSARQGGREKEQKRRLLQARPRLQARGCHTAGGRGRPGWPVLGLCCGHPTGHRVWSFWGTAPTGALSTAAEQSREGSPRPRATRSVSCDREVWGARRVSAQSDLARQGALLQPHTHHQGVWAPVGLPSPLPHLPCSPTFQKGWAVSGPHERASCPGLWAGGPPTAHPESHCAPNTDTRGKGRQRGPRALQSHAGTEPPELVPVRGRWAQACHVSSH